MKISEITDLVPVLGAMWARRWVGVAVAWGVAIAGTAVLYSVPDRWRASARVYVDTQAIIKPLLQGLAVQPDVDQAVTVLARTMTSRPNIERIVDNLDLAAGMSARERDELITNMAEQVNVGGGGGARVNIYEISYRSIKPERAKRVVTELLAQFRNSEESQKDRDTSQARKFIDDQIADYEGRLEKAEERLKDFRLKNLRFGGGAAGAGQDYIARMSATQQELTQIQTDLGAAERSRDSLRAQLAQEQAFLPVTQSRLGEIDDRISKQRQQLDELQRRFTDAHPDVIAARRLIAELEAERRRLASAESAGGEAMTGERENVVHQQIKIKLADSEAQVASLSGRAAQLRSRMTELERSAQQVPKMEAELAQLNRDYDVVKRNYDQLVQRREAASLSSSETHTLNLADFQVIDPPRVDPKPVFPNRAFLILIVLMAAIGAGVGICFVLATLLPTVQTLKDLRRNTARAVLGAVSLHRDAAAMALERRHHIAFFGSLLLLATVYVAWSVVLRLH